MRKVIVTLEGELDTWAKPKSDSEAANAIQEVMLNHIRQVNTHGVEEVFREKLKGFPVGFEFEVAQVVGHEVWNSLGKSERIRFGKQVKREQADFGIEYVRTTVSRHAVYKKV